MNAERLISTLLQSRCSDEEIVAFLPLLMKATDVTLEPATQAALFARVGELIGAQPTDTEEALQGKLKQYYDTHRPPLALQKAFEGFFDQASGRMTPDGFEALAAKARPVKWEPIKSSPVYETKEKKK